MVRSISDVPLFRDNSDKDKYLFYIKKYQKKLGFKVYAYCLMSTHGHLIIDANGADISKVMQGINQSYTQYYNFKYKRSGHVFQDRFKSEAIDDENHLFTLSAYIHSNPMDMEDYKTCPEKFKYSSLGVYLGLKKDEYEIVNEEFIMGFFSENIKRAREDYYKFVMTWDGKKKKDQYDFRDQKNQYRSEKKALVSNFCPEEVMKFITAYTNVDKKMLKWKYKREAKECRALCVFLLRYYCDATYKDICGLLGRLTLSRISVLSQIGCEIIEKDERYKNIMEDFLKRMTGTPQTTEETLEIVNENFHEAFDV
jgi:REP element-mobilizing transposase RayT